MSDTMYLVEQLTFSDDAGDCPGGFPVALCKTREGAEKYIEGKLRYADEMRSLWDHSRELQRAWDVKNPPTPLPPEPGNLSGSVVSADYRASMRSAHSEWLRQIRDIQLTRESARASYVAAAWAAEGISTPIADVEWFVRTPDSMSYEIREMTVLE